MFKSLYTIEGLSSRSKGRGHCGISITLDGAVAYAILKHKERRNDDCILMKMLIKELDNKRGHITFVEDSWLVRTIQLEPMSCSCFGIDGMRLNNIDGKMNVTWTPHNIDTPVQAAKLVSMWLYWFNQMCYLTDENNKQLVEVPFSV